MEWSDGKWRKLIDELSHDAYQAKEKGGRTSSAVFSLRSGLRATQAQAFWGPEYRPFNAFVEKLLLN